MSYRGPASTWWPEADKLWQDDDLESNVVEVVSKGGECAFDGPLLLLREVCRTVPDGTRQWRQVLCGGCRHQPDGQVLEYLRVSFGLYAFIQIFTFVYCLLVFFVFAGGPKEGTIWGLFFRLLGLLTVALLINGIWVLTVTRFPRMCCCSRKVNAVGLCCFQTVCAVVSLGILVAYDFFFFFGFAFVAEKEEYHYDFPIENIITIFWVSCSINLVYLLVSLIMWSFTVRSMLLLVKV